MNIRTVPLLFAALLAGGCANLASTACEAPAAEAPEAAPNQVAYEHPQRLTFMDSEVFDASLQHMLVAGVNELEIEFISEVRVDKVPSRVETWITGFATLGDGISLKDADERSKGALSEFVDHAMKIYKDYKDSRRFLATRGYKATLYYNRRSATISSIVITRSASEQ